MSCVLTGFGVVTSLGCGKKFWSNLLLGRTNFQLFLQQSNHQIAYVDEEDIQRDIGARILRKLDRFTLLAMQSLSQVIEHQAISRENSGILLGNSTGGWSFVESQMNAIYEENYDALSPYVATAWFPTAPQGELSIHYKIQGYSKTFAADALSVGIALEHGCYLLQRGTLSSCFVGGTESPLSSLVYNSCLRTEPLSRQGRYLPYHRESDGYLLGEGSAFVLVELEEQARARNAPIYARIASLASAPTLREAIELCLEKAQQSPQDVDCIFLDAKANAFWDDQEMEALAHSFHGCKNLALTTTKPLHGSLLSADFAVQLSIALFALDTQIIPRGLWSKNNHKAIPCGNLVVDNPIETPLKSILIYSRNLDGSSIAVLLNKPD